MGAKGAPCSMNTKGAQRKILSTLHPNTILKANLDSDTHPQPSHLTLHLTLPLPLNLTLTKIEYWDRVGGGRNIVSETSTTNEVGTGKWMRVAQKGLKMSCIHPFGHHIWTRLIFGRPWF